MLDLDLSGFTGTTTYYRWSVLFPRVVLTDGTKYLAETAGAYWLFDAIASYGPRLVKHQDQRLHEMQFWTLKVDREKHSATLSCVADSGEKPVVLQRIPYTDFPLDEIKLYCTPGSEDEPTVILLPSEY